MQNSNPSSKRFEETLTQDFSKLTNDLSKLLAQEGVKTQAHLEGLPYFSALSVQNKTAAFEGLKFYYDLCLEHVHEKQSLRDSKRFTWRALAKLGMAPPSDMLERISNDDIVEIYNDQQVQLFRNLEFFDLCSYTLEELVCVEWWRLFRREDHISAAILALVEEIFQKKHPEGLLAPFPEHSLVESLSREKFSVNFFMKYAGPLYKNKTVVGILCIERGNLI